MYLLTAPLWLCNCSHQGKYQLRTIKGEPVMKRIVVTVIVCVLVSAASLYAQGKLRVSVPFEFTTVSGTLPAGEYIIQIDPHYNISISGQEGQGAVWVLGLPALRSVIAEVITNWQPGTGSTNANIQNNKRNGTPNGASFAENCVVFTRYGDKYFLHELWTGYTGRHMTTSKAEHAIQTAGIVKPERLELAALVR
jgi:hypothetical protein